MRYVCGDDINPVVCPRFRGVPIGALPRARINRADPRMSQILPPFFPITGYVSLLLERELSLRVMENCGRYGILAKQGNQTWGIGRGFDRGVLGTPQASTGVRDGGEVKERNLHGGWDEQDARETCCPV